MPQIEKEKPVNAKETDKTNGKRERFRKITLLSHRTDGETGITWRMPCN
jgi:hypothetical protein